MGEGPPGQHIEEKSWFHLEEIRDALNVLRAQGVEDLDADSRAQELLATLKALDARAETLSGEEHDEYWTSRVMLRVRSGFTSTKDLHITLARIDAEIAYFLEQDDQESADILQGLAEEARRLCS